MSSKLVSMKITKAEREKRSEPSTLASDQPVYPWGLSLSLDQEALEKLGVEASDYEVDQELTLIATVRVTSVSSNQSSEGKRGSCSLQVTEMCLEDGAAPSNAAEKLYA